MFNFDGVFSVIALELRYTMKMKTEFLFFSSSDSFCLITSHMFYSTLELFIGCFQFCFLCAKFDELQIEVNKHKKYMEIALGNLLPHFV